MKSRYLKDFIAEIKYRNRNPRDLKALELLCDKSTNPEIVIDVNQCLFRARIVDDEKDIGKEKGFYGYSAKESFVPPVNRTRDCRANYRYIPYLYCANHPYIALAEVRPRLGAKVSVATIIANEPLMLLDFMGISFVVTVFLTWRKTGDMKQAIKAGASTGLQVFGVSFIQHMLVSQIARTGLASALMAPSQYIVGKLGFQNSATIVNGIRALSGKGAIHGIAASKHLAKILRSNAITSAIAFAVFSVPDTYKVASSKISLAQYAKNITVLVGSIAGGAGGAVAAGVAAAKVAGTVGTTISPGVGTAVGIVGGFVGGVVGSKIVDVVGDILHEDDSEILGRLFNAYVSCMISEYLLDASEIDKLMEKLDKTDPKKFKALFAEIFKSDEQEKVIRDFLVPYFEDITSNREVFNLPSPEEIVEAMVEDCE